MDSSGWLEYLTEDTKAEQFEPFLFGSAPVVVPTIVIYEVFKILRATRGEVEADAFLSEALRRTVVSMNSDIAVGAALASNRHRLAMADAIIYATAQSCEALLVTSDPHFTGLPSVQVI